MPNTDIWTPVNLADMFLTSAELHAGSEALSYKKGHHYESLTYGELREIVFSAAKALAEMGLTKGVRAVIISENRPEWVITDLAIQLLGAVNVPIHSVLSTQQISEIITEVEPDFIFYSDKKVEDKLLSLSGVIAKIEHLVSFDKVEDSAHMGRLIYFKDLVNESLSESDKSVIISSALKIKPDDLCSIIYTSGTTGHLKGVTLTHGNFVTNVTGTSQSIWALPTDRFFSILPLSHVFERTAGYYIPLYGGASISYCLSIETLSEEIQLCKPTIVLAVPRLYEKIYEKVLASANKSILTKLIFKLAFNTKKNSFFYPLFDKLVFSKVKNNFGGNIRFFISGGASLPKKIGQLFARVDMLVLEGYGLTETSPIISVNELTNYRFGTVGHPINNVKVKLAKDGEILVKGPSVTQGYMRAGDTHEAFTSDGYFLTGDLGTFDEAGFLTITGRKKDLMILTTGKKVAPVPIEEALEMSEYIEQAMVFGDAHKHIGAILLPDYDKLSKRFGISGKDKLRKNDEVQQLLCEEARLATRNLSSIEQIKKFITITESFTIENGKLTPTLKLRRHIIREEYAAQIEEIYS